MRSGVVSEEESDKRKTPTPTHPHHIVGYADLENRNHPHTHARTHSQTHNLTQRLHQKENNTPPTLQRRFPVSPWEQSRASAESGCDTRSGGDSMRVRLCLSSRPPSQSTAAGTIPEVRAQSEPHKCRTTNKKQYRPRRKRCSGARCGYDRDPGVSPSPHAGPDRQRNRERPAHSAVPN
jgi:hypothetical protein